MRNIRAEEGKVHLSGWEKKGKGSIRDYLWWECELVNETPKRTSTNTHSRTHTLAVGQMQEAICSFIHYEHKVNLMFNEFFKGNLTDRYSLDWSNWCANALFKCVLALKEEHWH